MPAKLSEIRELLRALGGDVEMSGGPHPFKATMPGKRPYPIKAHNGLKTEIGDDYIRGLCRNFDLDKAEFVRTLRGQK